MRLLLLRTSAGGLFSLSLPYILPEEREREKEREREGEGGKE